MKRILFVEDNEDNRDLVCAFLEDLYAIESYEDSHQALASLVGEEKPPPDLLLLDISLPGMDGVELLRRIRSVRKLSHIPAIALTAHAMKDDESRFMGSGFNGYVSKPIVDEGLLISTIDSLIASKSGGR